MKRQHFNIDKVFWEHGKFKPWHIPKDYMPTPLKELNLNGSKEIVVVESESFSVGFLKSEVIYHHIVQGEYLGKAFMVSYCVMCNAGVVMEPVVDGEYLYFEPVGVYNGQLLIQDIKTKSLWNHLQGECMHGKLKGKQLKITYLKEVLVKDEIKKNPELPIGICGEQGTIKMVMNTGMNLLDKVTKVNKNFLPGFFVKTIVKEDRTLPRMTKGLVVRIDNRCRFYEATKIIEGLTDTINGEVIRFFNGKIPYVLNEKNERPFQLFMRWYAYKINYPDGEIFT